MLTRMYHAGLASLLAAPIISLALGVSAWMLLDARYAVGWVVWTHLEPEGHQLLVQVKAPLRGSRMLLFTSENLQEGLDGHWLLAKGTPRLIGRWHLLVVDQMRILPFLHIGEKVLREGGAALSVDVLTAHRGLAVLLGVVVLLFGAVLVRCAAGLAGGVFGAILAWHMAVPAAFEGFLTLPEAGVPAILLLGCTLGMFLSFRRGSLLGALAQRLALLPLMEAFVGKIAEFFDWPVELTRIVGLIGTLLTPTIGLWLVGAYFLALGLGAEGAASRLVLGAAGLAMRVLRSEGSLPRWYRLMTRGVSGARA